MTERDLPGVMRVANEVHRDLPERESIFRERLVLFPEGSMVLVPEEEENGKGREEGNDDGSDNVSNSGSVVGYVVSFPIRHGRPPALDQPLDEGAIAPEADQYYLHDLAILPAFRGRGAAARCVTHLLNGVARRYPTTCLISVYSTAPFWARFGFFAPDPVDGGDEDEAAFREKLRGYGPGAAYLVRRNV